MSMRLRSLFLAVSLVGTTALAVAAPVTWTLKDVVFDDGGTATGSFVYDASANLFSDIDITTTGANMRLGTHYSVSTLVGSSFSVDFLNMDWPIQDGVTSRLNFFLVGNMSDAGGLLSLRGGQEFTCLDETCSFQTGDEDGLNIRRISGSIQAAAATELPEPASLALMGAAGLAAFGGTRSRRRR